MSNPVERLAAALSGRYRIESELGNREFRTAKLVADHLRALGLEVETEVAHTGVVGVLRGARPDRSPAPRGHGVRAMTAMALHYLRTHQ